MMSGLLSTCQAPVRYRVGADVIKSRRILGPLRSRYPWVVCGLSIQVLGVGMAGAVMWRSIRRQRFGGHITAEMIKFAWRSELHNRVGLSMLVAGSCRRLFIPAWRFGRRGRQGRRSPRTARRLRGGWRAWCPVR